nr:transposase [Salinibacter sp.]
MGRASPRPGVSVLGARCDAAESSTAEGRATRATAMLAVGISEDGQREILGLEMTLSETEEGWRRFIRQLKERGLSSVELATSDAHEGLGASPSGVLLGPDLAEVPVSLSTERLGPDALRLPRRDA